MTIGTSTQASTTNFMIEKEDLSPRAEKVKLIQPKDKLKSAKKEKSYSKAPTRSYQDHPEHIQYIFKKLLIPLIQDFQKLGLENNLPIILSTAANTKFFEVLEGIAQQSVVLKREIFQLAILKINLIHVSGDGTPLLSANENGLNPRLAISGVKHCLELLIASRNKKKGTENIWTSQDGKQFLNELSLLNQQHYDYGCIVPVDHLLHSASTVTYKHPDLLKFIKSTTDGEYEAIKKIVWSAYKKMMAGKEDVFEIDGIVEVEDKIIKQGDKYFFSNLKKASKFFISGLDKKLQNVQKDFKRVYSFRLNTIASVRVMKKDERKKHLNFLTNREFHEAHHLTKRNVIIGDLEHTLTIAKEIKTNIAKVITLNRVGSEEVDVYLYIQYVDHPHTSPNSEKESHLVKFEEIKDTTKIWVKEPNPEVKQVILDEFQLKKYKPSIYSAMKFENEIVLVEIFKQSGLSLNTRLRAGTGEDYLEMLNPKYNAIKETLSYIFESVFGAPISQFLAQCHHNSDLDLGFKPTLGKRDKSDAKTLLAKKAIAHYKEKAKNKGEDYLQWVLQSILGAGHDNPDDPEDLEDIQVVKDPEKINLEIWKDFFEDALKEKDVVLLGLVETIHASIAKAFDAHKKTENALKMLSLDKKEFSGILKMATQEEKFFAIFASLLDSWKLDLSAEQRKLCYHHFKKICSKKINAKEV